MRRIWAAGLVLTLAGGYWTATAQELPARGRPTQPPVAPALGRPVAADADDDMPAVPAIRLVSFQTPRLTAPVIRAQASEEVFASPEKHTKEAPTLFAADIAEPAKGNEPSLPAPMPEALAPPATPLSTDAPSVPSGPAPPASSGTWPAPPTRMTTPLPTGPVSSVPMSDSGPIPGLHEEIATEMAAPPGTGPRFYVQGEYLLWWIKDPSNPVLVTTGPAFPVGTPFPTSGFLGSPGTMVLNGGTVNYDVESGFRVTAGLWLDDCHTALETTFFALGPQNRHFQDNSDGSSVIARPFVSQNTGQEFAQYTAAPGIAAGSVNVRNTSRLWGLEENLRCNLCCGCSSKLDLIAGVRYLELNEGLEIVENGQLSSTVTNPPGVAGDRFTVYDEFATRNQFLGGQLGLDYELKNGPWSLDIKGKVALGNTHEILKIQGSQTVIPPGGGSPTFFTGGLLAERSNIGLYRRDRFTVIPELTLTLSYQINDNIRAFAGYNFLYWSNILSPGDQIDRVIDVNQIPNFGTSTPVTGPSHPLVPFKQNDFWAQGLNFGIEFRY